MEAARLLAKIAFDNKRFDDAEVFLRHASAITPDYTRLWVDLANVLRELHKPDEAMECATKVMELAPDMAESHMLYAGVGGSAFSHVAACPGSGRYGRFLTYDLLDFIFPFSKVNRSQPSISIFVPPFVVPTIVHSEQP